MSDIAVPPLPSAAADILSARTRSTGYMRVAVASAPAVIGGSSLKDIAVCARNRGSEVLKTRRNCVHNVVRNTHISV